MIVVVGLSHRTAPIEVRERLAIARERAPDFLRELLAGAEVAEAFVVSTCNRVELVAAGAGARVDHAGVAAACSAALEREAPGIGAHLYSLAGGQAVRHLFRVVSSLDSLVLGEPQILGQVKDGYEIARAAGTLGPVLHRTVPRALRAAKRVRNETQIGSGQVSVPTVAVDLTRQIFGDPRGRSALLVGSGEMAETVARLLAAAGARLSVVGRSAERVQALAESVGGKPRNWSELDAALVDADVVVTSTSAPGFVIGREQVAAARRQRRGRDQFYVDLAVPRDVDPEANREDGIFLYNIDDLSNAVAESLSLRAREAELAERLIDEETLGYERWAEAEQATPAIVGLRARLREALRTELERSLRGRLKHLGAEERSALEKLLESAENRVLHAPTQRLRRAATESTGTGLGLTELSQALEELFALERDDTAEADPVSAPSRPAERATGTGNR